MNNDNTDITKIGLRISPLEKDKVFLFCHKKTNKLLKAMAILLRDRNEAFAVQETLNESLALVGLVNVFFVQEDERGRRGALKSIFSLFTLVETLSALEILSKNNASILVSEYTKLAEVISEARSQTNEDTKNDLNEMDLSLGGLEAEVERLGKDVSSIGQIKDSLKDINLPDRLFYRQTERVKSENRKLVLKKSVKPKNIDLKIENLYRTKVSNPLINRIDSSDRAKSILTIIKEQKSVTIKDISSIVKDVSEKTIQRELLNLVSLGTLKKEGERRWSRYSLR